VRTLASSLVPPDHWVATDGLGGGHFVLYDVQVLDDLAPIGPEDAPDEDRVHPLLGVRGLRE
jgi:hypothetical protein